MKTTKVGKYCLTKQIGKGALGKVYLASSDSSEQVAIKKIKGEKITGQFEERLKIELEVLNKLKHCEYILDLKECFKFDGNLFMVMEFVAGGDLFEFVTTNCINEDVIKYIFVELLRGVKKLHDNNIVHHDLKLENILIGGNGNIKIIDLNYCCYVAGDCKISKFCGTEAYLAPELFSGEPYNGKKVDVWCLGVILFTMSWKRFPFMPENMDVLYEQTRNRRYLTTFLKRLNGSTGLKTLVHMILNPDPAKRPSIDEILGHPWLQTATSESYQKFLFEEEMCNRAIESCRC